MCKGMGHGCSHSTLKAAGLLGLRIAIGVVFMYMGYGKLGPGHAGATAMFANMVGLPGGGSFWAYFVGSFELLGGVMLILGAYARYAAVWLSIIMLVAMATVHRGGPFIGYFLPLAVLGGCLGLLGAGAGRWRLVQTQCHCKNCRALAGEHGGCGGSCGGGEKDEKMEAPTTKM